MRKSKYTLHEIDDFFCRSNLSCYKLGKLLDIPEYKIRRYLTGNHGSHVTGDEALMIDTAIEVISEMELVNPGWIVGNYRKGIRWKETVGVWNDEVRHLIQEREEEMLDNACDMIVFILSDETGRDEFREVEDPLVNGGLNRYGTDEFMRRLNKTIAFMD